MYSKGIFTQILNAINSVNATMLLIAEALTTVDSKVTESSVSAQDLTDIQTQLDAQAVELTKTQETVKQILDQIKKKPK